MRSQDIVTFVVPSVRAELGKKALSSAPSSWNTLQKDLKLLDFTKTYKCFCEKLVFDTTVYILLLFVCVEQVSQRDSVKLTPLSACVWTVGGAWCTWREHKLHPESQDGGRPTVLTTAVKPRG